MSMFVAFWCLASLSVTSDTIRISRILRWLLVRTEAKSTGNDGTFGTSTGPATRLTLQPIIRDPHTQHRMTDSFFLCGLGSFDSVARKIHVSFSRTCINTFALPFRIAFDQTQKFWKKICWSNGFSHFVLQLEDGTSKSFLKKGHVKGFLLPENIYMYK